MDLQNFTINEALDKHFDYQYSEVSNPKVLSQYTFEHNDKTFALRHLIAPEMGKLVTKVQVGSLSGKKFSNKLLGITDFKTFFSTIANILLESYLAPQSVKLAQKKYGIALVVGKKDFAKYQKLLTLTARRKLKKHFDVYEGTNEHPLASSFKVLYLVRKGKSFKSVFPDAYEALQPAEDEFDMASDTSDAESFDSSELPSEPVVDINAEPDQSTPPTSEDLTGLYVNSIGRPLYAVREVFDKSMYSLYGMDDVINKVKILTTGIPDKQLTSLLTPHNWKSEIWLQDEFNKTPSIYYSVEGKPGMIFRYNGYNVSSASLSDIYDGDVNKFKQCVPSSSHLKYKGDSEFYLAIDAKTGAIDSNSLIEGGPEGENFFVDEGKLMVRVSKDLLAKMKQEGTLPPGVPQDQLKDDSGNVQDEPTAKAQPGPKVKPGLDAPAIGYSVDYSETPPKKLTAWTGYEEAIDEHEIRTDDNTPQGVTIEGVMTIDYEDSFQEIYKKFDKIKKLTGASRDKVNSLINKYLSNRHSNAQAFANKLTQARPPLTYDERNVVETYTGSGYQNINKNLRTGKVTGGTKEFVKDFDRLFADKGLQLPKGMKLYRGQSNSDKEIEAFLQGEEVEFKAYVSCSMSPYIAGQFSKTSMSINQLLNKSEKEEWHEASDYKKRERYKVIMSIGDVNRIPVFVPGTDSAHNSEAEVVIPRGTKIILDGDLTEVHTRVMMGHFSVTGINGMSSLLENQAFKNFKMFCESGEATERQAKEMVTIMMMCDYVDDTERSEEETEAMYEFFTRMVSAG